MEELLQKIQSLYPKVTIWASEMPHLIELKEIEVPNEDQGLGIGTHIIDMLKDYARSVNKPIVLRPKPQRGKKKALTRFYKRLGFVDNSGRNRDYTLSSPFSKTMYWRFKEWLMHESTVVRYVHNDGRGLMNNSSLNYSKLNDDEYFDLEDQFLNLQQPSSDLHNKQILFVFTMEGEKKHQKLINLLTKASKSGVKRKEIDLSDYIVVWDSGDGQLGLIKK
jgi:hypothetical protein